MGKEFETWTHQHQLDAQFPNAKPLKLPCYQGMQNPHIPCAPPCTNAIPLNCGFPEIGFSDLPNVELGQCGVSHGLLYSLPSFRQGFKSDHSVHEKFLPKFNLPRNGAPRPKQFLVFDHAGDKMTMMYGSGIDASIQQVNTRASKLADYCNDMSGTRLKFGRSECHFSGTYLINESDDNHATTKEGSETHENTEEINALLYSDDEDSCSNDGEETSTGHSPSTMTAYEKQDWFDFVEDEKDEVASSAGPVKRQKLSDSSYEVVPSVTNVSRSLKQNRSHEYEDDAESSCGGGGGGKPVLCSSNTASLSGNKRDGKEKIRETVSILQTIVPSVQNKDTITVLDEAISYLRILKKNAISLGLSSQ